MIFYHKLIFFLMLCLFFGGCKTQKKSISVVNHSAPTGCDSLFLDLKTGQLNGVGPTLSQQEIKEWFTCYTAVTPDGSGKDCGGGVFYDNHKFYYYTFADYIEIREGYKGKLSQDLIGRKAEDVKLMLGEPNVIRFRDSDNAELYFLSTEYGCLRADIKEGKVIAVAVHYNECEVIDLCY